MTNKTRLYLLHGWSIDGRCEEKWEDFIKALKKKGYDAKLLKIPGLSAPLNEVWGLQQYVDWLASTLPDQPVILLGHSFGGQLAIKFASAHPNRVKNLILIDSAGLRDWSFVAKTKRLIFQCLAKIGKRVTQSSQLRRWLYIFAREKDYFQAPPLLRQTMAKVIASEVWSDLAKITMPTLIIWGKHDRVTPIKMAKIFSQKIANSHLVIIEGARHAPHFSHSVRVARQVVSFLDQS